MGPFPPTVETALVRAEAAAPAVPFTYRAEPWWGLVRLPRTVDSAPIHMAAAGPVAASILVLMPTSSREPYPLTEGPAPIGAAPEPSRFKSMDNTLLNLSSTTGATPERTLQSNPLPEWT